jgi:hypothetical protein
MGIFSGYQFDPRAYQRGVLGWLDPTLHNMDKPGGMPDFGTPQMPPPSLPPPSMPGAGMAQPEIPQGDAGPSAMPQAGPGVQGVNAPQGGSFFGQQLEGGGLFDRLGQGLSSNALTLMALGGGIAQGGIGKGLTAAAPIAAYEQSQRTAQGAQLALYQSLRARGLSHSDAVAAATNEKALAALLPLAVPKYSQFKSGETYGRFNESTGQSDIQGVTPKFEKLSPGDKGVFVTPPVPGGPGRPAGSPTSVPVASGGPETQKRGLMLSLAAQQQNSLQTKPAISQ